MAIALIIGTGLLIIVPILLAYDYLDRISAIITVLAFAMSPMIYFVKKWHDAMEAKGRTSENLHVELGDTRHAFEKNLSITVVGDKGFCFINRFFSHDFYDSLIFSGKIEFLRSDILLPLQNVYQVIKDHNRGGGESPQDRA